MALANLIDPLTPLFWFVAGAVLLALEILLPAFLALGFGIGAWVLAGLMVFVLPGDMLSVPMALMLWALLSGAAWVVLRIVFRNRFSGSKGSNGDINEY